MLQVIAVGRGRTSPSRSSFNSVGPSNRPRALVNSFSALLLLGPRSNRAGKDAARRKHLVMWSCEGSTAFAEVWGRSGAQGPCGGEGAEWSEWALAAASDGVPKEDKGRVGGCWRRIDWGRVIWGGVESHGYNTKFDVWLHHRWVNASLLFLVEIDR